MNTVDIFERIIKTQSGVLFVKGKPGIGKTALFKAVAEKNNWNFIDCRLAQLDETDIIGTPEKIEYGDYRVTQFAHPKWLVQANERPTLILFDELNRASLSVRNAALQILNERQIGDLKLNDNVFMVATGNLGEEDGCEVEELDNALNNRLVHWNFELTFSEWKSAFADAHVNSTILGFLENNGEYFYRNPNDGEAAYPTPRSWTFLSDLIGKDTGPSEFLNILKSCGHAYIGGALTKFLRYCEDTMAISVKDIIERYPQIKKDVEKLNRDRKSELLSGLKKVDLVKFSKQKNGANKLKNVSDFLNLIDEDERVGFLNDILENIDPDEIDNNKVFEKFLTQYSNVFGKIKSFTVDS